MDKKILKDYVTKQMERGVEVFDLRKALSDAGWKKADIDGVIKNAMSSPETSTQVATNVSGDAVDDTKGVRKKRFLGKGLLIFLLLTLVIIGVSATYGYFKIYLAPEKVLARSQLRMQEVKTISFSGKASIQVEIPEMNPSLDPSLTQPADPLINSLYSGDYVINFSGQADGLVPTNRKSNINLNVKAQGSTLINLEAKEVGKSLYLNVKELADLQIIDASIFVNRWIGMDLDELTRDYYSDLPDPTSELDLSQEEEDELMQLMEQNPPLENIVKLGDESIEGVQTYHYSFKINKTNLSMIFFRALEMLSEESVDDLQKQEFDKQIAQIEIDDVEVWIGKKDWYVYKLKIVVGSDESVEVPVKVEVEIVFMDHNQPVVIQAPQGYSTFQEVLMEYLGDYRLPTELEETPIESSDYLMPSDMEDFESLPQDYQNLLNFDQGETAGFSTEKLEYPD